MKKVESNQEEKRFTYKARPGLIRYTKGGLWNRHFFLEGLGFLVEKTYFLNKDVRPFRYLYLEE